MKTKNWLIGCGALLCFCLAVTVARSDEKQPAKEKEQPGKPGKTEPGQAGHEMSAEEQKMHEAYLKAATPGPEHARLAKMAGKWKAEVQFWHGEGEPQTSYGTAEFKPILGGRYIEETFNGEAEGQPFEGRGVTGYDNIKKKYIAGWIDSMSTSIMTLEGDWNEAQKAIVSHGESTDPFGAKWKIRSVCREDGANKRVYEMYKTGTDGKEIKCLQVTYTRA
jgi:hypothetical protein